MPTFWPNPKRRLTWEERVCRITQRPSLASGDLCQILWKNLFPRWFLLHRIFPFQKLFNALCFACNTWIGPKFYWDWWDDSIYDSREIGFQFFESETLSNSKINCDRKCSPCQTPCVVLSLSVKFKQNVNSLCSLRNLQLPCAGSHDIEFPKTLTLFPFLVSCSNLFFPGFLFSVRMGFGSSDFWEIDTVRIRCCSCQAGTAFLTGIWDHEGVATATLSSSAL